MVTEIQKAQEVIYAMMKSYRLNEIASRICSVVYLSPDPVSLEELALKTQYSPASISNTTKFLNDFLLIKRVKKPGSKKIYVTGRNSPLEMMKEKTAMALANEVKPIKESFPELIKKLEGKKKYERELLLLKKQYKETLQLEKVLKEMKKIIDTIK
jgi:DNA-binding transcriptional regulator GbsR (MarR family)